MTDDELIAMIKNKEVKSLEFIERDGPTQTVIFDPTSGQNYRPQVGETITIDVDGEKYPCIVTKVTAYDDPETGEPIVDVRMKRNGPSYRPATSES